ERHRHASGDHVRGTGEGLNLPHRSDLAPGHASYDAIHHLDELGRGEQRVLPAIHRGRPRVIRETIHCDVPAMHTDDPLDDTDVELLGVERCTLLDVKLDVTGDVSRRTPH